MVAHFVLFMLVSVVVPSVAVHHVRGLMGCVTFMVGLSLLSVFAGFVRHLADVLAVLNVAFFNGFQSGFSVFYGTILFGFVLHHFGITFLGFVFHSASSK
jgi:hypothetical protein